MNLECLFCLSYLLKFCGIISSQLEVSTQTEIVVTKARKNRIIQLKIILSFTIRKGNGDVISVVNDFNKKTKEFGLIFKGESRRNWNEQPPVFFIKTTTYNEYGLKLWWFSLKSSIVMIFLLHSLSLYYRKKPAALIIIFIIIIMMMLLLILQQQFLFCESPSPALPNRLASNPACCLLCIVRRRRSTL